MKLLSLSAKISLQIQKEKVVSLDKIRKEYRFPATDIHGWKCMECNYGEISQSSVESYLAHSMLPYIIIKSMIENSLEKLVDDCMEVKIEDVETKRQELAVAAEKSNISLKQNPIRPCCRCGGSNTSIFRWRLLDKETPTGEKYKVLEPSKSNIRNKK